MQIVITWKLFYKHWCLASSLRDSDLIDWEVRALSLLLFKNSEGEKGMWEGVSAGCVLELSARAPAQSLSRGLGLLRACQLGSERESFKSKCLKAQVEATRLPVTQPQKPQSITSVTFYLSSKSLRQTQKQGKRNLTPPPGGIQDHIFRRACGL